MKTNAPFWRAILLFAMVLTHSTVLFSQIWQGISTDWTDPNNWDTNTVPDADSTVYIVNRTFQPEITTTVTIKTLSVQGGGMTVGATGTLHVGEGGISISGTGTTVTNEGTVTVNGVTFAGLYIGSNCTFQNNGTLNVGNTGTIDDSGIQINGTLINDGTISINRASTASSSTAALSNLGTCTNNGTLNIGDIATNSSHGVWLTATTSVFTNSTTGVISINRTDGNGFHHVQGTFNNYGNVTIGDVPNSVVGKAINQFTTGNFNNAACGTFKMYGHFGSTGGAATNNGHWVVDHSGGPAHSNSGTFTNNGLLEFPQGSPIPNITNNEIIVSPKSGTDPLSPVLGLGSPVDFTIASNWYLDAGLTMLAGTFNLASNEFTNSAVPLNTATTVYFEVTDNGMPSCTRTASINLTINGPSCPASGTIWYVDGGADPGGTGTSWDCAFQNVQDAINAATASSNHEIWVKTGTYLPTEDPFGNASPTDPRDKVFYMKNGVALYGGFDGTETMRSERDWVANVTTLSGDIGTASDNTDNCYHVVLSISDANTTVLDGFTVEKGNANGSGNITVESGNIHRIQGGGMYNRLTTPTVANCTFSANEAGSEGGGMHNLASGLTISNCSFIGNTIVGGGTGAGLMINGGSPTITNCLFSGNVASGSSSGGGMYLTGASSAMVSNCRFLGNTALSVGGGMSVYGSTPTFVNCLFSGNLAAGGGAMENTQSGNPNLINCTITGNRSTSSSAGGISNISSTPNLKNCIIWNNRNSTGTGTASASISNITATPVINYSLVQNHNPSGTGNLNGITPATQSNYPNFVGPLNPIAAPSTAGDFHLTDCSPVLNLGDNTGTPATDLFGNTRIFGGTVDLGVHELQSAASTCPAAGTIWYVDGANTGCSTGTSWDCAFQNLQDAIDAASSGHEIWVKTGTHLPTKDPFGNNSPADPRDKTFYLKNGVAVYGGFDGTETMRSERDWMANVTTLSGDIGTGGDDTDNCYHVVLSVSDNNSTVLDGFTVTKGKADGSGTITVETRNITRNNGAGMYNISSSITMAKCIFNNNATSGFGGGMYYGLGSSSITDCTFSNNSAAYGGGFVNTFSGNPTLTNCTFSSNTVTDSGAGVYEPATSPVTSSTFINCSFINNTAGVYGGGYYTNSSTPSLTNCTFTGNSATTFHGGGIYGGNATIGLANCTFFNNSSANLGGGIYNTNSTFTMTNCSFSGNLAVSGGGVCNVGAAQTYLTNCTISGNKATSSNGGGMYNSNSSPTLTNCIIWNNRAGSTTGSANANLYNLSSSPVINYSLIQNHNPSGTGNLDGITPAAQSNYPNFVTPLDPTTAPSTAGDFHITSCSPVLNVATNTGAPATDLFGNARPFGGTVDMGVHELQETGAGCPASGTIWYVDGANTGCQLGTSWACAFQNVQDAIDVASSGHEVWVKTGTYLPTKDPFGNASPTDPRDKTIYLKNGVAVYGGFDGTETMRSERDWTANVTTLSGDLGTADDNTDNAYHVLLSLGDANTTILDGFTVEKANANGTGNITVEGNQFNRGVGGGMANILSSPTITNCIFSGNTASLSGGGMSNSSSSPTVTNCVFSANIVTSAGSNGGGGMDNSSSSTTTLTACTFLGNTSEGYGGGMSIIASSPSMTNCLFSGNVANLHGGGGLSVFASSAPTLINCTITGNKTTSGTSGGMYNQGSSAPVLTNCIIWNNRQGTTTGSASANLINLSSIPVITYSLIQNHNPSGTGNLNGIPNAANSNYPNFVTPLDPATAPSVGGDFHIQAVSPVVNVGNNTGLPATDLFGNTRIFGTTVDLGVHELQSSNCPTAGTIWYVDASAASGGTGTSWACAFQDFQSALSVASAGHTVLVAEGIYKPSVGGTGRQKRFVLGEGVVYYGGFPSGGGNFASRDFDANRTILSGDIGTPADSTDNCFNVVDASGLTDATLMSGFTVERGNADSSSLTVVFGRTGGVYLGTNGNMRLDSVTIRNNYGNVGSAIFTITPTNLQVRGCSFDNNNGNTTVYITGTATGSFLDCSFDGNTGVEGGAFRIASSSGGFSFTNCDFTGNISTGSSGGGALNYSATDNTFTDCNFIDNQATVGEGGAISKNTSNTSTFTRCLFQGNSSADFGTGGGAAYTSQGGFVFRECRFIQNQAFNNGRGGAVYNNAGTSSFENCLFRSNSTNQGWGGALYNNTGGTVNITNCTFNDNSAGGVAVGGGLKNNSNSNATILNSIFWGNKANGDDGPAATEIDNGIGTLTVTRTVWQGATPSGTIYDFDPLFTDAATGDLTLTSCSPAIDTGDVAGAPVIDLAGAARPFDARPGSASLNVDLGAYERQSASTPFPTTANAGPDQTGVSTCGLTQVTLAANNPTVGTGAWSVFSGTGGSFGSANSPTSTFTGTAGAAYVLRWTISNTPCTPSTDDVNVTFNLDPAANAGSDQSGCETNTFTLAANNPTVGTGAWSVFSGPSTSNSQFGNTASPTSTFTPSGGAGTYTLRWTVSNAPCNESTDDVDITASGVCCPAAGTIWYVDAGAASGGTGTSWNCAFQHVQDAIDAASSGHQVWVKAGTYKPTTGADRTISFVMKNDVAIYGGFDGMETMLSDRDWATNVTILSGDIGTEGADGDNSYHVIFNNSNGVGNTAVLDGFTITKGNADGNSPDNTGGGMSNWNVAPTVANCIFQNNYAAFGGGAYFFGSNNASITNCLFYGNTAGRGGGVESISSTPAFTNCTFTANNSTGTEGDGIFCALQPPTLTNCIFWGNLGAQVTNSSAASIFTNCIVEGGCPAGSSCTNVLNADPMFVSTSDAHLQSCSPAIDAGTATGAPADDLDGNSRPAHSGHDIGAYEFQGTVTTAVTCYLDADMDTYGDGSMPKVFCNACGTGYVSNNTDCDDGDANEYPGQMWYIDADGDDYGGSSTTACLRPTNGFLLSELVAGSTGTDDCDDTDVKEYPGQTWYIDADGDDFGVSSTTACLRPMNGFLLSELSGNGTDDCNDNDANEHPGQMWYIDADGDDFGISSITACIRPINGFLLSELASGSTGTDDCDDGDANEYPGQTWYIDVDGDDYGVSSTTACLRPTNGFVLSELAAGSTGTDDCNDNDANEHPGQTWYIDADSDDYGGSSTTACLRPTNGFLLIELAAGSTGTDDCDDGDANEHPGQTWYIDADGDDFGVSSVLACTRPTNGFLLSELAVGSTGTDDCDDTDASEHPGQTWYIDADGDDYGISSTTACLRPVNGFLLSELASGSTGTDDCDDMDSNEHPNQIWYADADSDGYGASPTTACLRPFGKFLLSELTGGGDCDDMDAKERPGQTWYIDSDADGYGALPTTACLRPANGFLLSELMGTGDCNNSNNAVYPGAPELCDGLDNNCNGSTDETCDLDMDGYTTAQGDCNDNNNTIYPGAPEICDGLDNNCNGTPDEGTTCCPNGNVLYVDASATGANDGSSWADALTSLQDALALNCSGISEIWVAAGTYKPTTTNDRSASFQLKNGKAVYGGFEGDETALSERDWSAYPTILSGDIGTVGNATDNSYHVVKNNSNVGPTAILDGFTITGGNANKLLDHPSGGGMWNDGATPTVRHCTFIENSALARGGGMYNSNGASPHLEHCTFDSNTATDGGGMANVGSSSPTIDSCTFYANNASSSGGGSSGGGAIYCSGASPHLDGCSLIGNITAGSGGGMLALNSSSPTLVGCSIEGNTSSNFGGGLYLSSAGVGTLVTNCLFASNSATFGGGVYSIQGHPTFTNCGFLSNSATSAGGGAYLREGTQKVINGTFRNNTSLTGGALYNHTTNTVLTNGILWGNSATTVGTASIGNNASSPVVTYSIVQQASGIHPGTGNLNVDPLFTAPAELKVSPCSPVVNSGNSSANSTTEDLGGAPRVAFATIDMGAFENQTDIAQPSTWTGDGDGASWDDPLNWSEDLLPLPCRDVLIPTGFNVAVPGGVEGMGKTLEVKIGSTLTTDPSGTLNIGNQ